MSKLKKRLEKLENILRPPKLKKRVMVIQLVGETEQEAIARAGITDQKSFSIYIIRLVAPEPRKQQAKEEYK
jgi:hypothetical protein